MRIQFSKYQGSGNDFILIDNRDGKWNFTRSEIAQLCHRRFGVGGDGLILLNSDPHYDFEMKNYNSDGGECTMCGNGGRTLVQFAHDLGIKKVHYRFRAIDGEHEAYLRHGKVELKMQAVREIKKTPVGFALDTGSPHLVISVKNLINFDVVHEGRKLRNSPLFMPNGINVNFVERHEDQVFLRTYERGVEDETLSCGTGAIATAIVDSLHQKIPDGQTIEQAVQCQGGQLEIRFKKLSEQNFDQIWLIGPAIKTFEGNT